MAGCNQEWFESLSAWHDGEVTDADARRISAHVAGCAACHRAASLLGQTRTALASAASQDVPPQLRERVAASLESHGSRRRSRAWWALALVPAAAAAALMLRPHRLPSAVKDELVNHHLVGFARERPCDFSSSDPTAVASWLRTELGYPVDVSVPRGTQLLGARLCRIEGTRTAALMLMCQEKPLTVFVPPERSVAASTAYTFAGDGMRCTTGPLGKSICVKGARRPLLAVAETDATTLASALQSVSLSGDSL